jgi:hypothetical protein
MSQKLNKKLSLKTLGWTKDNVLEQVFKDKENSHALATFIGKAVDTKNGQFTDPSGEVREFSGLRGTFKGTNLHTGVEMLSAICYLPDIALDVILGGVGGGDNIEFAVVIYARFDSSAATSYVYEAEFLTNAAENADMFGRLEAIVAPAVQNLLVLEDNSSEKQKAKK